MDWVRREKGTLGPEREGCTGSKERRVHWVQREKGALSPEREGCTGSRGRYGHVFMLLWLLLMQNRKPRLAQADEDGEVLELFIDSNNADIVKVGS